MPFIGELIQVREDERAWEGAAERLLHNFGLSLLVSEAHYAEVAAWVDSTNLGNRLVYYRVRANAVPDQRGLPANALARKLAIKPESRFYAWIDAALGRRFDHACCDKLDEIRREKRAVTRNGQIKAGVAELGEQFDAVRDWIKALEAGSKAGIGHGYDIVWREINHRQLGRNRLPDRVLLASEADALRVIGRQADARRFDQLAAATIAAFLELKDWLGRRAPMVLEQGAAWERILAILQWFAAHPRPQLCLRQLDIAGVDSKFIETRKPLLADQLDQVLPPEAIDAAASGARQFEARYGLLGKPALIRFRIFDRLRASLPQARSMLVDVATLHAHRPLWGAEEKEKRYLGQLSRLSADELALFDALRDDVFGERIRMEQERLGYGWVLDTIARM